MESCYTFQSHLSPPPGDGCRYPTGRDMKRTATLSATVLLAAITAACFLRSRQSTPRLDFATFTDAPVPRALLTLTNPTSRQIFFAGYGPNQPLQSWQRLGHGKWIELGCESCGSGRSNYTLGPNASITVSSALRNYRHDGMSTDPDLAAFTTPMRLVLYYGFSESDIQHPIVSAPFYTTPPN